MRKSLFLIGMMGCGKTTIGRRLAARLGCDFLDLDEDIAAFEGKSIPEIFSVSGDDGFRLCETASLRRACAGTPKVIATGGGIVTREENIALMRENGLVLWLNRPLEEIIKTVRQDTRPNLAGDKAERMRTLYANREALYARAAHIAFVGSMSPSKTVRLLSQNAEIQALL